MLKSESSKHYVSPLNFASLYAELSMKEETLKFLEAAYEERTPWLVFLQADPDYDFLHADERYRAIVRKIGFPPA